MVTASRTDLARMALNAVPMTRALALAQWTGTSRELTSSGVLRPAVAVQACRALGIDVPSTRLRSAKDVPELDQAWAVALAADLVRITANRVSAAPGAAELVTMVNKSAEAAELDDDTAERVVLAWLRGAGAPLGVPDDVCPLCLAVLHELRDADGAMDLTDVLAATVISPRPDLDPGDQEAFAEFDLDFRPDSVGLVEHILMTVGEWVDLGAVTPASGQSPGGTVTLTPLGDLLVESVFSSLSPPATDSAEDLVTALAWMPPEVALVAAQPWLAARTTLEAVRELLEFAAAYDGPVLRSAALEIARRQGAEAMPVWREYANLPGFGAYARQWLAAQEEPVAADDKDEGWLLVDSIVQSGGRIRPLLRGTLQAIAGASLAEALAGIESCGHPHAADVARMLSGGPAVGFRTAPETDVLYQLKITLLGVSKPPVWRRVLVHADASLGELHEVIMVVMGWQGGHLHGFSDVTAQYSPDNEDDEDEDEFAIADVLVEPGDRLGYTYDFGDDWDHEIKLEKVLPPDPSLLAISIPACLAGKGACPPEDCGGRWGYAALKEKIADPSAEEHQEMLEWLGLEDPSDFDPAAFDLASVNARLRGSV